MFKRRKLGAKVPNFPGVKIDSCLGRVYTIHRNAIECFHLRLLLHETRGPTSIEDLKTVNGVTYNTIQLDCKALRLLKDDKYWDSTMEEAAIFQSPNKL